MSAHDPVIVVPAADDSLELVHDARGSLVHVRRTSTGECLGCIETGLFELLSALILAGKNLERWS